MRLALFKVAKTQPRSFVMHDTYHPDRYVFVALLFAALVSVLPW